MIKQANVGNRSFLIFFSISLSLTLIILLIIVNRLEEKFEKNMIYISTKDIIEITKNTALSIEDILNQHYNCIKAVKNSVSIQQQIDTKLSILVTKNIKYAYLLYRDNKGVFRFLADGAKGDGKAMVDQKFDIQNPQWLEIYKTKKPIMIKQPLLHQLSITYLIPLIHNNQVQMILAIDFSIVKTEDINKIISFVKNIIISIIIIIFIFASMLLVQMFKYFTVKKKAYIDKLTGVYNRNYLQEIEESVDLQEYILAAIDIDFFKLINDRYGHDIGDLILHGIAKNMLQSIRSHDDIVIRYGGEEFVILVKKQKTNEDHSLDIIKRIFQNIREKQFKLPNGELLNITVSIGVNLHPEKSLNFKEAFKLADIALYKAKNSGRNKIEIYTT